MLRSYPHTRKAAQTCLSAFVLGCSLAVILTASEWLIRGLP